MDDSMGYNPRLVPVSSDVAVAGAVVATFDDDDDDARSMSCD